MTAQSCGKWNKQQNHFLTDFHTFSLIPHARHRGSSGNASLFLFCQKAPDLGLLSLFSRSQVVCLFLLSTFLRPHPKQDTNIAGAQGFTLELRLTKSHALSHFMTSIWLLSRWFHIPFSSYLPPVHQTHVPAAWSPCRAYHSFSGTFTLLYSK